MKDDDRCEMREYFNAAKRANRFVCVLFSAEFSGEHHMADWSIKGKILPLRAIFRADKKTFFQADKKNFFFQMQFFSPFQ